MNTQELNQLSDIEIIRQINQLSECTNFGTYELTLITVLKEIAESRGISYPVLDEKYINDLKEFRARWL